MESSFKDMDYFSILPIQLSIELVSHVILLTLGGILILHLFGIGNTCYDGTTKVSHPVLGGGLLYGIAIILSFFVDRGSSETYTLFFSLFLVCILGSYLLLFYSTRQKIGLNTLTAYYFEALLFGAVYTVFAVSEFTHSGGPKFLWYVLSELGSTVSLFVFVHAYLTESRPQIK